jgi:hypothetical protein
MYVDFVSRRYAEAYAEQQRQMQMTDPTPNAHGGSGSGRTQKALLDLRRLTGRWHAAFTSQCASCELYWDIHSAGNERDMAVR